MISVQFMGKYSRKKSIFKRLNFSAQMLLFLSPKSLSIFLPPCLSYFLPSFPFFPFSFSSLHCLSPSLPSSLLSFVFHIFLTFSFCFYDLCVYVCVCSRETQRDRDMGLCSASRQGIQVIKEDIKLIDFLVLTLSWTIHFGLYRYLTIY